MASLVRILPVAIVLAFAKPAHAVPIVTPLATVLRSDRIVIAKVHGASARGIELDVERVLKGTTALGAALVTAQGFTSPPYPIDTRLVAFLGPGNAWLTSGLASGGTLETGVLHLDGLISCCDASTVMPGVLTLTQLESALKGTPVAWKFRGNLVLPGPAGPTRSTIDIEAEAPSGSVRGPPMMAGFASPTVQVSFGVDSAVFITWNATAPRSSSPLQIIGEATGKNADGSIAVTYRLASPAGLTETAFRRYVGDASLVRPYFTAEVVLSDGTKMALQVGKDMGRVGTLTTSTGTSPLSSLDMAPTRSLSSSAGTIELDPRKPGLTVQRTGAQSELVQELLTGPIGCRFVGGGVVKSCTVDHVATKF